jgi:hypothetical protein
MIHCPTSMPHPCTISVPQVYAPSRTVVVYAPSEFCDPQVRPRRTACWRDRTAATLLHRKSKGAALVSLLPCAAAGELLSPIPHVLALPPAPRSSYGSFCAAAVTRCRRTASRRASQVWA